MKKANLNNSEVITQRRIESDKPLLEISITLTKNLLLLNGGVAVALLPFFGQIDSSDKIFNVSLSGIIPSLLAFLLGSISSVGALGVGYFAQLHFIDLPEGKNI